MSRREAAVDAGARTVRAVARRGSWLQHWYVPLTAAGLVLIALIAVFRMESSVANYDPQYMRVLVERTMRFGGSYYSNGIHNKGPIEPLVYEVAAHLGGRDGWWFVIAVFTLAAALLVGWSAAVVTVRAGGTVLSAVAVCTLAAVHLTLSEADYAGVLYARNITTTLIAIAFAVSARDASWRSERSRRVAVAIVGLSGGFAVQTLLTACFTATPVLLWAMWERRHERVVGRPVWVVLPVVAAMAFLSAPIAYLLIGPWQDFVDGFWTHARFMSTGTGRSLVGQFELGWEQFRAYYGDRWAVVAVLVAGVVLTALRWRRLDRSNRMLRAAIAAWWFGAWIEMILSQRYSSHYFSIIAVPTIMVIALIAADASTLVRGRLASRPAARLLPLVVAFATIQVGGWSPVDVGVDAAATVTSTEDLTARREQGVDGRTRMVRATLDLVSDEGDPILMWTSYPWPYLNLRRTSATRYIWKTFLVGEIYLGETGPEYVLPGTWDHFAADLAASDPTAYVVESVNPIDPTTPFRTVVDERFGDVYVDDALTLGLRNDLAAWISEPAPDGTPVAVGGDGPATVATIGCVRVDGSWPSTAPGPLTVELVGDGDVAASLVASIEGDTARVESNRFGVAGHVAEVPIAVDERIPVSLIVGARAAVLVVDGRVGGAVEIEPRSPVTITSGFADLSEYGATTSVPPSFTGC